MPALARTPPLSLAAPACLPSCGRRTPTPAPRSNLQLPGHILTTSPVPPLPCLPGRRAAGAGLCRDEGLLGGQGVHRRSHRPGGRLHERRLPSHTLYQACGSSAASGVLFMCGIRRCWSRRFCARPEGQRQAACCCAGRGCAAACVDSPARCAITCPPTCLPARQGGWMHTGDLASIDGEGYCSIVGRMRDVVIRGG